MTAIAVVVVPFVEAVSRDPGKSQVTGITRSENSGVFHFEFRLFFREVIDQIETLVINGKQVNSFLIDFLPHVG